MSASDASINVGGLEDDQNNGATEGGIIAAYVLFAIGAVLVTIVIIWILRYCLKRRKEKKSTVKYQTSTLGPASQKVIELPSVTYTKPVNATNAEFVEVHTKPKETVQLVQNGHIRNSTDDVFTTLTRPAATSTIQRAYLVDGDKGSNVLLQSNTPRIVVEDTTDATYSRPRLTSRSTVASNKTELKRAYLITETAPAGRALSVDGYGTRTIERQRLVVKGGLKRTSSDPKINTKLLVPPGGTGTLVPTVQRERVISTSSRPRVYSSSSGKVLTEPAVLTGSVPTLVRLNPGKVKKKKIKQEPKYYMVKGGGYQPAAKSYQVENWVQQHHTPIGHQRQKQYQHLSRSIDLLNEDLVDGAGETKYNPLRRAHSLTEIEYTGDELHLQWSPSMKTKMEDRDFRRDYVTSDLGIGSSRSLPMQNGIHKREENNNYIMYSYETGDVEEHVF